MVNGIKIDCGFLPTQNLLQLLGRAKALSSLPQLYTHFSYLTLSLSTTPPLYKVVKH